MFDMPTIPAFNPITYTPPEESLNNTAFLVEHRYATEGERDDVYTSLQNGINGAFEVKNYQQAAVFFQDMFKDVIPESYLDIYKDPKIFKVNCPECCQAITALILNVWTILACFPEWEVQYHVELELDTDDGETHSDTNVFVQLVSPTLAFHMVFSKMDFSGFGDVVNLLVDDAMYAVPNIYIAQFIYDMYHKPLKETKVLQ